MVVDPTNTNSTVAASSTSVSGAIRNAARATGTDFQYLVATAQVESKLNPNAAVSTSSAKGLFQFIDQTWLTTVKEQGAALGYGRFANAISRAPSGQYVVTDPRLNDQIMNLRFDPSANAMMAGAFTKANAAKLESRLGRPPSGGERYVAHFLGSAGASRLIGLAEARPSTRAADVFPGAAQANPSIFFDKSGQARSAADVYRTLVGRYDVARGPTGAAAPVTASNPVSSQKAAFAPDTAALTETFAAAARMSDPPPQAADATPVFHGLFRTSAGREAVAPVVSALWGTAGVTSPSTYAAPNDATAQAANAATDQAADPAQKPTPLDSAGSAGSFDLFRDLKPDAPLPFRGRV